MITQNQYCKPQNTFYCKNRNVAKQGRADRLLSEYSLQGRSPSIAELAD